MVAFLMLTRRNVRNVLPPETRDLGVFGGRIHDDDTGADVAYRVKRLPVATGVAFVAGALASLIGIGGGVVIVPALNTLCGVPIRVAAATSVLMIGVTTIPGVAASWRNGFLDDYHLAALTSMGALVGFQIGLHVSPRFQVKWLKVFMACLLSAGVHPVPVSPMTSVDENRPTVMAWVQVRIGRPGYVIAFAGLAAGSPAAFCEAADAGRGTSSSSSSLCSSRCRR